jgi:hypothetical protein
VAWMMIPSGCSITWHKFCQSIFLSPHHIPTRLVCTDMSAKAANYQ